MAQFAQGNTFATGDTGVGPYIIQRDRTKPAYDAFATAYNNVLKWRAINEEENEKRRIRIKKWLDDVNISTDGVRPIDIPFFLDMKAKMQDRLAKALEDGRGDLSVNDYMEMLKIQEIANGLVSQSKEINARVKSVLENYIKSPDKYSEREVEQFIRYGMTLNLIKPDAKRIVENFRYDPEREEETGLYMYKETGTPMKKEDIINQMRQSGPFTDDVIEEKFQERLTSGEIVPYKQKRAAQYKMRINDQWIDVDEKEFRYAQMSAAEYVASNTPLPYSKTLYDLAKEIGKDFKSTDVVIQNGIIKEITGVGEYDPKTKRYKSDDVILNAIRSDTQMHDVVMEEWSKIVTNYKNTDPNERAYYHSIFNAIHDTKEKLMRTGMMVSDAEAYGILVINSLLPETEQYKAEPYANKAYAAFQYRKGGAKDLTAKYKGLYWRWVHMLTGTAGYTVNKDGSMSYLYAPSYKIGNFDDGTAERDNFLNKFDLLFDANGNPVYRFMTTEIEMQQAGDDGSGYVETADPGAIVTMLANGYGDKSGEVLTGWVEFLKENDLWDEASKTIDVKKAKNAIKEYDVYYTKEYVLESQKLAVENNLSNLKNMIDSGKLQLLPGQSVAYDELKKLFKSKNMDVPNEAVRDLLNKIQE